MFVIYFIMLYHWYNWVTWLLESRVIIMVTISTIWINGCMIGPTRRKMMTVLLRPRTFDKARLTCTGKKWKDIVGDEITILQSMYQYEVWLGHIDHILDSNNCICYQIFVEIDKKNNYITMWGNLTDFCPLCRIWWPLRHSSKKIIWLRDWSNVTPPFCWISSQQGLSALQPGPSSTQRWCKCTNCREMSNDQKKVLQLLARSCMNNRVEFQLLVLTGWPYDRPVSTSVTFGVTISKKAISTIGLLLTGSIPTGSMGILGLAICRWPQVAVCGESMMHTQTVMASMLAFMYEGVSW